MFTDLSESISHNKHKTYIMVTVSRFLTLCGRQEALLHCTHGAIGHHRALKVHCAAVSHVGRTLTISSKAWLCPGVHIKIVLFLFVKLLKSLEFSSRVLLNNVFNLVLSVLKTVQKAYGQQTDKENCPNFFVKSVSNQESIHLGLYFQTFYRLQKNIAERPAVSLVIYYIVILLNIFCNNVRNLYVSK